MNITIPDSLPKLLVLIGIIAMAFGIYVDKELDEEYYNKFDRFDKIQDAVTLESYLVKLEKKDLLERARQLSKCINTENPIKDNDSIISFLKVFSGDKRKVLITDSLEKYWNRYITKQKKLDILIKKKEIQLKNLNSEEKLRDSRKEYYNSFFNLGLLFFIMGIFSWYLERLNISNEIKQNKQKYNYCQSCGYKFSSIRPYGTEKNNKENFAFCIECYNKGKMNEPELTKEEFINRKKEEIKHKNWFTRKILMARFNKLERWNKNKYF